MTNDADKRWRVENNARYHAIEHPQQERIYYLADVGDFQALCDLLNAKDDALAAAQNRIAELVARNESLNARVVSADAEIAELRENQTVLTFRPLMDEDMNRAATELATDMVREANARAAAAEAKAKLADEVAKDARWLLDHWSLAEGAMWDRGDWTNWLARYTALTEATQPKPRSTKDENWAKKIEIAKQAREAGQAIREGKSPVVPEPKLATKCCKFYPDRPCPEMNVHCRAPECMVPVETTQQGGTSS